MAIIKSKRGAASINFKPCKSGSSDKHNERNYISQLNNNIDSRLSVNNRSWVCEEYNRLSDYEEKAKADYIAQGPLMRNTYNPKTKTTYEGLRKRTWAKNYVAIREAVVANLTDASQETFEKLQKLGYELEKKYKIKLLRVFLHADEHRVDPETGEDKFNIHGHLVFGWYNFDEHKLISINPDIMCEIQDLNSEITGLPRGNRTGVTGRRGLGVVEFKQNKDIIEFQNLRKEALISEYNALLKRYTFIQKTLGSDEKTVKNIVRQYKSESEEIVSWIPMVEHPRAYANCVNRFELKVGALREIVQNNETKYTEMLFNVKQEITNNDLILKQIQRQIATKKHELDSLREYESELGRKKNEINEQSKKLINITNEVDNKEIKLKQIKDAIIEHEQKIETIITKKNEIMQMFVVEAISEKEKAVKEKEDKLKELDDEIGSKTDELKELANLNQEIENRKAVLSGLSRNNLYSSILVMIKEDLSEVLSKNLIPSKRGNIRSCKIVTRKLPAEDDGVEVEFLETQLDVGDVHYSVSVNLKTGLTYYKENGSKSESKRVLPQLADYFNQYLHPDVKEFVRTLYLFDPSMPSIEKKEYTSTNRADKINVVWKSTVAGYLTRIVETNKGYILQRYEADVNQLDENRMYKHNWMNKKSFLSYKVIEDQKPHRVFFEIVNSAGKTEVINTAGVSFNLKKGKHPEI